MIGEKEDRIDVKNSGKMWHLWGIPLFGSSMSQLLKLVDDQIGTNSNKPSRLAGRPFWIATVNPEFVMEALKDRHFFDLLKKTDLNVNDGIALVWTKDSKILEKNNIFSKLAVGFKTGVEILQGKHREELVPGVELMEGMIEMAVLKNKSVYFFGGWGDRAKRTADYFREKFPKLKVAGYRDEDFDFGVETDILFVARGMKKQEMWIEANFDRLRAKVVMGVGRSFDYYSGELKRAPEVVRMMGFEWLYSLFREPKRWRRQLALPRFVMKVLWG